MKTSPLSACGLAVAFIISVAALQPTAVAQTSTVTDPVGFADITVAGNGGSGTAAYTFTAIGMTKVVLRQGTTTSAGGATTLVDTTATWADNAYNGANSAVTHYVEIVSGPGAGTIYDITGTSASGQSLTLSQPLLASITSGASYKVRQHWTIASVFGTTLQGGSSTTADQVQLFHNGSYVSYYFQTGTPRGLLNTWVQSGFPNADAGSTIIYPDDGVLVARYQSAGVSVTIQGAVKTGQTSIPVLTGYTLLGNVYASGMTLANCNLYTGNSTTGVLGGSSTAADQVMFWDGTNFVSYYYQSGTPRGVQNAWVKSGFPNTDVGSTTAIPVGAALFIKRSGAQFNWVVPQFPTTFN